MRLRGMIGIGAEYFLIMATVCTIIARRPFGRGPSAALRDHTLLIEGSLEADDRIFSFMDPYATVPLLEIVTGSAPRTGWILATGLLPRSRWPCGGG